MSGEPGGGAPWTDRPKPRAPWPVWLLAAGFWVFFTAVPALGLASSGGVFPAALGWVVMSLVGGTLIAASYGVVRYELDDHALRARAGLSRATVELAAIVEVDVTPWYTFFHPRNLDAGRLVNSWTPMLRIVDSSGRKLLLTPTNPEEMRDEILRRRDHLRGPSDA